MHYKGRFVTSKIVNKFKQLKPREKTKALEQEEKPYVEKSGEGTGSNLDQDSDPEVSLSKWTIGRRIVELGILADGLKSCNPCKKHLMLENCIDETVNGLGSILYIKCNECDTLNAVPTGKRHSATGEFAKLTLPGRQ